MMLSLGITTISGLTQAMGTTLIQSNADRDAQKVENALQSALSKLSSKINNSSGFIDGTYLVGEPSKAFVITGAEYVTYPVNKKSYMTVNHGPIKEQAAGLIPNIVFAKILLFHRVNVPTSILCVTRFNGIKQRILPAESNRLILLSRVEKMDVITTGKR